jgi:adenine-specific DNA-methyltransferase
MARPIEQYRHTDKERANNPPAGLVTPETDKESPKKTYRYDPHIDPALQFDCQRGRIEKLFRRALESDSLADIKECLHEFEKLHEPYLNWAGKAENTAFEVPTVSLHVHERIDPRTIIEAVRKKNGTNYEQLSLFSDPEENPPIREAIEFYKHKHNWSNRLVAGDSLLVMNSLLEKEGMAGQVQMVYIDPPYGIRYGSNFQPFVNKRDVKDGKDDDLTQEPEMIKAFRDTWELGIHSYLTYLRDRLLLARELLSESGSCFVQISDENIHHVRELMDEVFGKENFVSLITFQKTGGASSTLLPSTTDFIILYGKNKDQIKYRQIYEERRYGDTSLDRYDQILLENNTTRRLTREEVQGRTDLPIGKRYQLTSLLSDGETGTNQEFSFNGKIYNPRSGTHWKTTIAGLSKLVEMNRIEIMGSFIRYRRFVNDFPVIPITDRWESTQVGIGLIYVVQTANIVIQRCLLMTTDPGDLVLDITCGSGTTAFVAEQWGRRWITCDTSRVAVTLAKQRLMTAMFDYYELEHPKEGISSGFKYKKVPHITLKSIANNEPPGEETLYDQPFIDTKKTRVTGPFTVEAVPAPVVVPLEEIKDDAAADESVARKGKTLKQSEWKDELYTTGIRGKGGQKIEFSRVESLSGTKWLHAEGETKEKEPQKAVVSFGSEHAPLEQKQVSLAIEEAQKIVPRPKIIVFAAFQFDPEAARDIDETNWPGVTLLKVQMNTDLLTEDLKKKRTNNESFWLIGQPDILLKNVKSGVNKGKYLVDVNGFDYYDTRTGNIVSGGSEKIALWMLDTDYDGRAVFPRQVFFPLAGEKEGWARLANNLKAELNPDLIEAYRGTKSLPFEAGKNKRIAVKIVDDRGIESLKVMDLP